MSFFEYLKRRTAKSEREDEALCKGLLEKLAYNAEEDSLRCPEEREEILRLSELLREDIKQRVAALRKEKPEAGAGEEPPEEGPSPVDADCRILLTDDRMRAFICLLPPLAGGREISLDAVLSNLRYEGVGYGLDEALLKDLVAQRSYLHIHLVARGKAPKNGVDAKITDFYKRKNVFRLEVEEREVIDFSERDLIQAIHKGELICRLEPAVPGEDGMDVTGRTLRAKAGRIARLPQGLNTLISQDGLYLIAGLDGAVCVRDGKFCVERQKVIFSNADASMGNLDYPGEILFKGDVSGGLVIKAKGNIIIEGEVRDAHIFSEGSVRIQRGIRGGHAGSVRAAQQVQCGIIEGATVTAGGNVYADVILDSDVTSGGSIYLLGGRGLLAGGQVKTRYSVEAKQIGNQSGCLTLVILGYNPELKGKADDLLQELNIERDTLEKLRKHISTLWAGKGHLSLEKRELLNRLTEQRELHEQREAELNADYMTYKQKINDYSRNRVVSGEILATTTIRLGEKSLTVKNPQRDCSVHMASGLLTVR